MTARQLSDRSRAAAMLAEFHAALGDKPGRGNLPLRLTLHTEEHRELEEAIQEGDHAHIARELADVIYVAYGTAHALAIDLDAALAEIHRAAMSKLRRSGPADRARGRKSDEATGFRGPGHDGRTRWGRVTLSYHGPLYVPTPAEIREIRDAMHGRRGAVAAAVRAKCDAVLTSDSRLREPMP